MSKQEEEFRSLAMQIGTIRAHELLAGMQQGKTGTKSKRSYKRNNFPFPYGQLTALSRSFINAQKKGTEFLACDLIDFVKETCGEARQQPYIELSKQVEAGKLQRIRWGLYKKLTPRIPQ